MDNNESWASLIKLALEKVKNGISKRTWEYNHQIDIDADTYWKFWQGKAVSGNYTIEIGLSEYRGNISAYSFAIKNAEELGFQIIGQPYYADEPSTVIMHYLRILQDAQEDF